MQYFWAVIGVLALVVLFSLLGWIIEGVKVLKRNAENLETMRKRTDGLTLQNATMGGIAPNSIELSFGKTFDKMFDEPI
jgi:type II secretory pathway pseudopilin PulG